METVSRLAEARLRQKLERGRSVLLLGPRQTGKTTLIERLEPDLALNLIRPELRQRYERTPELLSAEVEALRPRVRGRRPLVAIDEVQRAREPLRAVRGTRAVASHSP